MQGLPDISPFRKRLHELDELMSQPDFYQNQRQAAEMNREHQKISRLLEKFNQLEKISTEIRETREIQIDSDADEDLKVMAEEELPLLQSQFKQILGEVIVAMIPPDPGDSRNTIMEIRAGAGGDEASLFCSDLFRMYCRFAENRDWKIETLSSSPSECGGFKEVVFQISGDEVYKVTKFESGVHRVQRVPVTETNGRIHTSTVTVAVLPEAEDVDVEINPEDLEISVARASGPGGQGVNTTDSAVQILHKPTGLIVKCADERSQLKNKNRAMKVLRARLLEQKQREEREKYAQNRRKQVGTGDRSERIRTYNYPQGRITEHRIGLTLYNLEEVLGGQLNEILDTLQTADQKLKIEELSTGE